MDTLLSPSPDAPYNPSDALLQNARVLLAQAHDIFKTLAEDRVPAVVAECSDQMRQDVKKKKGSIPAEKVLQSLSAESSRIRGVPMFHDVLTGLVRNTYDEKMENI